ncbi:MAG: aldo/keto reductase [Chloroflexota bacterium]|nr:aldo/keto reductase [Chloroflexota bacterium]
MQVSELCLGCMMFGGRTEDDDSADIIDRFLDAGGNFLDTANVYTRGRSEEATGKALKRNGKRDKVVLATKVHGAMADDDPNAQGNSRRHIIEQCEASLRRLQTDYIDLYQIHRPDSQIPIDETLRALDDLIRAGKVRYVGTSTYAAWQLVEALWVAKELGLNRFVCEQPPYHLLDRRIERELVPFAQTYGFGIIPWSPLAGGFLTGKYQRGGELPADSRYGQQPQRGGRDTLVEAAFDVLDVVEKLAKKQGCSPSQIALAWVKDQPAITSPIIGPRTMEQLEDNLAAANVQLAEKEMDQLNEVTLPGRAVVPYYEADFGPHLVRVVA